MSGFAISGKAGSGKSTMARYILAAADEQGRPAVKIAFGDELKREVMELYGIDKHMVGGREVLIRHGEEKRLLDPDYWIRPVTERVRLAQASGVIPVIDDLRFKREYWWARRYGLVTVRMVASLAWRSECLLRQGLCDSYVDSDSPTETQLDRTLHQHNVRNHAGAPLAARAVQLLVSV